MLPWKPGPIYQEPAILWPLGLWFSALAEPWNLWAI